MGLFKRLDNRPILFYWIPFCASLVIIAYFSLTPSPFESLGAGGLDLSLDFNKLHGIAYFALSFFLGNGLKASRYKLLNKSPFLLAIFVSLFLGSLFELAQNLVPGRTPDLIDLVYNLIGISAAQIILVFALLKKD